MSTNYAAWMLASKQKLQVKEAPYPIPGPDEVVVKNRAVAINPIDWILQDQGTALAFGHIKYPFIFGHDVAGEVVQVGKQVTRFRPGDRVVGQGNSTDKKINSPQYGTFQLYSALLERTTAKIPDTLAYENAAVLPLGLTTAAAGLFEKDQLGLQHPGLEGKPIGKTLLVWGGSTSVGCNAIQLAVSAGYEVFSTCSPKNAELLKSLGASQVFDYKDPAVVENIIAAMKSRKTAGAIAIGENSVFFCLDVLGGCEGDKHIAMATFPVPAQPKRFALLQILYCVITSMISIMIKSKLRGIVVSVVYGSLAHTPLSDVIYDKFLTKSLAEGTFRAAPEPIIAGDGLGAIQEALEMQKRGVSAGKIVVRLG